MDERIIGLDIGTAGARAVVFDPNGGVYAVATNEYPTITLHPGWGEQEPEVILQGVVKTLADAVAKAGLKPHEVTGIGISSVMHSLIALDAEDKPLTNAWLWVDSRAAVEAAEIKAEVDPKAAYRRTGCPIHAMYAPAKARHLRKHNPELFNRTSRFVSTKEYVITRLFGQRVVDYGIASGSGLLNMERKSWDEEVAAMGGIRPSQLSELVEPTTLLRGMRPEFASAIGILPETPVAVGSSDGPLSSLGVGAVKPGQMNATIGTSGAVRAVTDRPTVDPECRTWCYYLAEDRWVAGAAINNAGIVYRWVRDDLLRVPPDEKEQAYQAMDREAASIPAGSNGLIFLPFLAGERAPYWNADARGVLMGLSLSHTQAHVVRATLEGVAYRMQSIFTALQDVAGKPNEVRATGGFTKSELWVQILADMFGHTLRVPVVREASAFGAAYLAMLGLGIVKGFEQIASMFTIEREYVPDRRAHETYLRLYDTYIRLYWHLQDQFSEIAAIQREESAAGGR